MNVIAELGKYFATVLTGHYVMLLVLMPLQNLTCGELFVALITLKLLLPMDGLDVAGDVGLPDRLSAVVTDHQFEVFRLLRSLLNGVDSCVVFPQKCVALEARRAVLAALPSVNTLMYFLHMQPVFLPCGEGDVWTLFRVGALVVVELPLGGDVVLQSRVGFTTFATSHAKDPTFSHHLLVGSANLDVAFHTTRFLYALSAMWTIFGNSLLPMNQGFVVIQLLLRLEDLVN